MEAIESWIVQSGKGLRGQLSPLLHFIDKTEAQRGAAACLRLHGKSVAGMPVC